MAQTWKSIKDLSSGPGQYIADPRVDEAMRGATLSLQERQRQDAVAAQQAAQAQAQNELMLRAAQQLMSQQAAAQNFGLAQDRLGLERDLGMGQLGLGQERLGLDRDLGMGQLGLSQVRLSQEGELAREGMSQQRALAREGIDSQTELAAMRTDSQEAIAAAARDLQERLAGQDTQFKGDQAQRDRNLRKLLAEMEGDQRRQDLGGRMIESEKDRELRRELADTQIQSRRESDQLRAGVEESMAKRAALVEIYSTDIPRITAALREGDMEALQVLSSQAVRKAIAVDPSGEVANRVYEQIRSEAMANRENAPVGLANAFNNFITYPFRILPAMGLPLEFGQSIDSDMSAARGQALNEALKQASDSYLRTYLEGRNK